MLGVVGGINSVLFKTPACGLIILHMRESVQYHLFKTSSDLEILGGGTSDVANFTPH